MTAAAHDNSAKHTATNHFLPTTFEERGVAVPFTTPTLVHARVRKNYRDKLELSVPQFASIAGHYIIPWSGIRELVELTLHDRLLYDYVAEHDVRTPHDMRIAALSVAASGLAGPEVADAAAKAMAAEDQARAVHHVALILRVLEETGKGSAINLREITSADRQQHMRASLVHVASDLGVSAVALDQRINEFAIVTAPVGTPWSPVAGRLRVLLRDLAAYRDSLRKWGVDQINEAGEKAMFCAEVADLTLSISADLVRRLNVLLTSPFAVVVAWDAMKDEIDRLTCRLSWLLDGWDMIIQGWKICVNDAERIEVAEEMVPFLPLIPRDELDQARREQVSGMINFSRRWVRLNHDWSTGARVVEAVHRIESVKARAL